MSVSRRENAVRSPVFSPFPACLHSLLPLPPFPSPPRPSFSQPALFLLFTSREREGIKSGPRGRFPVPLEQSTRPPLAFPSPSLTMAAPGLNDDQVCLSFLFFLSALSGPQREYCAENGSAREFCTRRTFPRENPTGGSPVRAQRCEKRRGRREEERRGGNGVRTRGRKERRGASMAAFSRTGKGRVEMNCEIPVRSATDSRSLDRSAEDRSARAVDRPLSALLYAAHTRSPRPLRFLALPRFPCASLRSFALSSFLRVFSLSLRRSVRRC